MSLAEVGERLDVSRGRVAQLEKPEANLEVATLVRVADALDYDVVVTLRPRGQKRERNAVPPHRRLNSGHDSS